jgi:(p)ppGpp synthase/HD superfamily hydrolase
MNVERAIAMACAAHRERLDKVGQPYILHPLRVMLDVPDHLRIPAVLHDVLEDSNIKLSTLKAMGLTVNDEAILVALTKLPFPQEKYFDYIRRVKQNPGAVIIKVADIKDNSRPERQTPEIEGMIKGRYKPALEILLA